VLLSSAAPWRKDCEHSRIVLPRTPNHSDHQIPLKVIVLGKKRPSCTRMTFRMLPKACSLARANQFDATPVFLYVEQIPNTCESLFAQSNLICVGLLWWYQRLLCIEVDLVPVGYSRNPGNWWEASYWVKRVFMMLSAALVWYKRDDASKFLVYTYV
jgi:hypothetical protein